MTPPPDPVETAEAILEAEADAIRREALAAIESGMAKVRPMFEELVKTWERLRGALISAGVMDDDGRLVELRRRRAAVYCRRRRSDP